MPIPIIWVAATVLVLGLLARHVLAANRYRRRGDEVPIHTVGGILGATATGFLLLALLLVQHGVIFYAFLAASMLCLGMDLVLVIREYSRRRGHGQA